MKPDRSVRRYDSPVRRNELRQSGRPLSLACVKAFGFAEAGRTKRTAGERTCEVGAEPLRSVSWMPGLKRFDCRESLIRERSDGERSDRALGHIRRINRGAIRPDGASLRRDAIRPLIERLFRRHSGQGAAGRTLHLVKFSRLENICNNGQSAGESAAFSLNGSD